MSPRAGFKCIHAWALVSCEPSISLPGRASVPRNTVWNLAALVDEARLPVGGGFCLAGFLSCKIMADWFQVVELFCGGIFPDPM